MIPSTAYQPKEDAHTLQKMYKDYTLTQICIFQSQSMHFSKFPGSICKNMQKMTCLGDRTCSKLNLLVIKTWVSSLNLYLHTAKDPKKIGWEFMMQCKDMFFMMGVCLWSNLRLFMHECKHHLLTPFFWYLKNYPSKSGQAFCSEDICSAHTLWAISH